MHAGPENSIPCAETDRPRVLLGLYEVALDTMAHGLCLFDANYRVVLFNRRYLEMFNLSPQVMRPGMSFHDVLVHSAEQGNFPKSAIDQVWRQREERLARGKPFSLRQQLPCGATIGFHFRPLDDLPNPPPLAGEGRVGAGWVSVYEDVTVNQQLEYELRTQVERLNQAVGNMSHGLCMFDADERLIVCNEQYRQMYGLDPEVVKPGVTFRAILAHAVGTGRHGDRTADELYAARIAMVRRREPVTDTLRLDDGRVIETTVRPNGDGGWVADHLDVTVRLRQKEALRQQNLLFDAALTNMSQGLCMLDADLRVIVCNRRYIELFGLTPEIVKPGVTIREIMECAVALGRHPPGVTAGDLYRDYVERLEAGSDTFHRHLGDGRVIEIHHQPMPQGGWVATYEDVTERHRAEQSIAHMARHDALTDLPNRFLFREQMAEGLARVEAQGESLAVFCLDLDNFKSINDTLGHPIGDRLLQIVAERLGRGLGEGCTIARLGGDEFAILQHSTGPEKVEALVRRLVDIMAEPIIVDTHEINVATSFGIAIAPNDGTAADHLMKCADLALYRAKAEGRGTFRFFEPDMDARIQARHALKLDLRRALAAGELGLVYQPEVSLATNELVGMEALLRWDRGERRSVPPAEFIPIAEEIGLIGPLGEWVLRRACAEAARWPEPVKVAVNLSPIQFRGRSLVGIVTHALAAAGLAAARLELEITEAVLLQDDETVVGMLHQLRALGVRISMDDFGTGYSSLSYLRSFPFDKIKIDRSFVADLDRNRDSVAIIRAIAGLGASLGIETTAEGIETADQLDLVRRAGCTGAQGYLVGAPRPAADAFELIARWRGAAAAA